jgi:hypothetical protein
MRIKWLLILSAIFDPKYTWQHRETFKREWGMRRP